MQSHESASKSQNPKALRIVLVVLGIFFGGLPIILVSVFFEDIQEVLNGIDGADYFKLIIAAIVVLIVLSVASIAFGSRKTRPVAKRLQIPKSMRVGCWLIVVALIILLLMIGFFWSQAFIASLVLLGTFGTYFVYTLFWRTKTTIRALLFVYLMIPLSLGTPVFLGSNIIYWDYAYHDVLNGFQDRASKLDIQYGTYGGWVNPPLDGNLGDLNDTGFFHVDKVDNKWWFVDPDGNPFISKGINHVSYWGAHSGDTGAYAATNSLKYDSYGDWARATRQRIREWNFNTYAPWTDDQLVNDVERVPYTVILDIATRAGFNSHLRTVPDYFDLEFEIIANATAATLCTQLSDDPYLLGYFTDNELIWGPDWRTYKTLIQFYQEFSTHAPGKQFLLQFLENESGTIEAFNRVWDTSISSWSDIAGLSISSLSPAASDDARKISDRFAAAVVSKYSDVCTKAIRASDPNHLILGCRFASYLGDEIMAAAGAYFDVVSLASYSVLPPVDDLDRVFEMIDTPFLIEEFSFLGYDSGLFQIAMSECMSLTQNERAVRSGQYIVEFIKRPYAVGYHWYKWLDNPDATFVPGANVGLVNKHDEPYEKIVSLLGIINYLCEDIHVSGS